MDHVVIDIETRSVCDLKKRGTYAYAADPTTAITHVGYKNGQGGVVVWRPPVEPIPNRLADMLADERVQLVAHNAGFERLLLGGLAGRAIGIPEAVAPLERWSCTAARGSFIGLPRNLDGMCRALKLKFQKDVEGQRLMMRVCKPRSIAPLRWWDDDDRMARMSVYCRNDVEAEAELHRILPELSAEELEVWRSTERVNDRGIRIDQDLLGRLIQTTNAARLNLDAQISELTDGMVPKTTNAAAVVRWLSSQGIETEGAAKSDIDALFEGDAELPEHVAAVLELRRAGGGSSSQKTEAIARYLSADGRLRGSLVYCGAPATGRWSSHGPQMQNIPRTNPDFNSEWLLRDIGADATLLELIELHGAPLKIVSSMLRSLLIAGCRNTVLIKADYSQIEARVLGWLAGEEDLLDVFRAFDAGVGADPYRVAAAAIFGVPVGHVTKEQRKIGKVSTLSLGYQGGARAFKTMGRNYDVKVSTKQAETIKAAWRSAHPRIVAFWHELEAGARHCIMRGVGTTFDVGRVRWRRERRALSLRLPSGRKLFYWWPTLKEVETPWGERRVQTHYWSNDAMTRQWMEFGLYGGLACENITQATARDLLADALVRIDASDWLTPVLTIHDEVVVETVAKNVDQVRAIMLSPPGWAAGLPMAVDIGTPSYRYPT